MNKQSIAMTRQVSSSINHCELTHLRREPIDVSLARLQHKQYEEVLSTLGCQIVRITAAPTLPDAVFVEDIAIVLDEIAVITRPGAASRRGETPAVAAVLKNYRTLAFIEPPGTLEGGDVLRLGKALYVGESGRSNREGIRQLQALTAQFGYAVHSVPLTGCLHLKSAVTQILDEVVLVNPAWVNPTVFAPYHSLEVDDREPYGANALRIGDTVVYPAAYPRTRDRLVRSGLAVMVVDVSELIKAEGAVTCCSVLFEEVSHC